MRILGIDPGLGRTGYALLEDTGKNIVMRECGCVTTTIGEAEYKRLVELREDLNTLITKFKPDAVCVESLFFATNVKTAMSVSQARGVILVTAAEHKAKIIEVTPLQVKIAAT